MLVIDQLIQKIDETRCPIVVGLDPLIQSIPESIKDDAIQKYGNTKQGAAEALYQFNIGLLDQIHQLIPAVKLQMACYEMYGSYGVDVFERTVKYAKDLGLIVIDDSKRNDIGSTANLYALGHLGKTPLIEGEEKEEYKADFLTINPLLGSDNTNPFIKQCQENNRGIFILVRTSNPSSKEYQEALIDDMPLYHKIAADVEEFGEEMIGERGFTPIGAVVGATWPQESETLREIMPHVYFLVPGYGAQGATADDVVAAFNDEGYGALINSSRGIIFAYQQNDYKQQFPNPDDYAKAAEAAVIDMRESLANALKRADKLPENWQN